MEFEWPWQYSFPPFYTLQPNINTRQKQLEAWCQLILSYHRHHKIYKLDISEVQNSPLFNNKDINRKLSIDNIHFILEELRKKRNLEWIDKNKRQCFIMWRTVDEWANLIYKWASDTGHTNSVCTLYELTDGDYTKDQEFYGLDKSVLLKALKYLELQKKAEVMIYDTNEGVKFL
ncbi:hypothetical protein HELRODRAFT_156379 [Helobdella robusta]|uniref:Vacuolar protein-sorting-associated protein 25 n=1 Tax=Helobdella robusta TaxID=6412 RepID=T1ELU8_HELRO|nr:hypothetical protein HELRODRAFT_156379 [Helobdella robusta]ESO10011.1 hypothetical protein HELRODRAFT_156379 [Helobdella robusta]